MAETDPDEVAETGAEPSVNFVNTKNLGDAPAFYAGLSMRGAVESHNALSAILAQATGKMINSIITDQPSEIAGESSVLALLGKLVQQTPPPTNLPTQGESTNQLLQTLLGLLAAKQAS